MVAEVNGEEISKDEFVPQYEAQFQRSAMQSQMSGQQVDQGQLKTQVVEGMVGTELLIQEANSRNIEVSKQDVDDKLDELVEANQLESTEKFMAAMKEQGLDKAEVRSQLEKQVKVERLIADEAGDIAPTEKQLKSAYDEVVSQQEKSAEGGKEAEVPSFKELRPRLEEQLKSQKKNDVAGNLVSDLRSDADVTINL